MKTRVGVNAPKKWTKPTVRRLRAGAADFGAEGQMDGDGFS